MTGSRVIETNLTGTLRACQVFGETMVKAGYGRIVNIASLTYVCSVLSSRCLCRQQGCRWIADKSLWRSNWRKTGVNVNAIAPGDVPD